MIGRISRYTTISLLTLGVLLILWELRSPLMVILLSLFLTAAMRPLLQMGHLRNVPPVISNIVLFMLILGGVGGFLWLIGGRLTMEFGQLVADLTGQYELIFTRWQAGEIWQRAASARLPLPAELVELLVGTEGEQAVQSVMSLGTTAGRLATNLVLLLSFSVYWGLDQTYFERLWLSWLPAGQRIWAREVWRAIEFAVGTYLRYTILMSLIVGGILTLLYLVLGLSYPFLLAALGFVAWYIPLLGFAILVLPVFLVGLGKGLGIAILATVLTLAVLLLLKYYIEPRYLRQQRYSTFAITFWAMVLGSLFGLGGLIAGPPVAVAAETFGESYRKFRTRPKEREVGISTLLERFEIAFREYAEASKEDSEVRLEIASLLGRMDDLLSRVRQMED